MDAKKNIDAFGAGSLIGFALLLAFNQVTIKVVNDGFQPAFFAGLRSAGAVICVWGWMRFRGRRLDFQAGTIVPGIVLGVIFAAEFLCLFIALDLTSVTRTSIIFYSMPVWLAVAAHFVLPGERIHGAKAAGLMLAFLGVVWAFADRGAGASGETSLLGDLAALGAAMGWGGVALMTRATSLSKLRPDMQLFWCLAVSAVILLAVAPLFGPLIRDLQMIHLWGLAFQIVVVVAAGFMFWLWLLTIYPASSVASFSFLSPIFGIFLGWLMLGEKVGYSLLGAGALVAVGLILINRPARTASRPG